MVLDPDEEGGYTVTVPALPGCVTEGDTREEALANIREAIMASLETRRALGLPSGIQVAEIEVPPAA